jgi:peptidoglycan biosynthesis protein MviN/MurJ (putative lipid II flippase)
MGVEGLALALSVSATLEVIGLLIALRRRLGTLDGRFLLASVARSSVAAVLAGIAMFIALGFMNVALGGASFGRLLTLLVPATVGGLVFLGTALVLRAPELATLRRLVRRTPR